MHEGADMHPLVIFNRLNHAPAFMDINIFYAEHMHDGVELYPWEIFNSWIDDPTFKDTHLC